MDQILHLFKGVFYTSPIYLKSVWHYPPSEIWTISYTVDNSNYAHAGIIIPYTWGMIYL